MRKGWATLFSVPSAACDKLHAAFRFRNARLLTRLSAVCAGMPPTARYAVVGTAAASATAPPPSVWRRRGTRMSVAFLAVVGAYVAFVLLREGSVVDHYGESEWGEAAECCGGIWWAVSARCVHTSCQRVRARAWLSALLPTAVPRFVSQSIRPCVCDARHMFSDDNDPPLVHGWLFFSSCVFAILQLPRSVVR